MSILSRHAIYIRSKLEQLLPAQPCLLCGAMSRKGLWCSECDADLPYLPELRCPQCALPTPRGEICGQCLRHPFSYDHTVAAFAYRFPMDKLIQALKFNERLILAEQFAATLAARIDHLPDSILPMPLHPERLTLRGFNQSLELARNLSGMIGIPVIRDACHRVRDTAPQSSLPWQERKKNMHGAFACSQDLRGKRVALVDDVMTTGASLNELAKSVRSAGASQVSAWVIARTLPNEA